MASQVLEIGSAKAAPGEVGHGHLKVGELAMNAELLVPVLIVNGAQDGPVLWLNGAVHGDELNAFMATRNICRSVKADELAGGLVCTPVCNPLAVQWRNKINPYDFLDLDQQFPGKPDGQYSQRVAHILFSEVRSVANALVSFHTVATSFEAEPYAVYKLAPGMPKAICDKVEALAMAFGARATCRVDLSSATGEIPGGVAGALDINCSLVGIPAFMAEVGSGGRFQPDAIATAEAGIRRVMAHLGISGPADAPPADRILIEKRGFLYSDFAGFLDLRVRSGATVPEDGTMGSVIDLFSELGLVRAPAGAHILMTRQEPVVHVGDRIAFLGLEWGAG